MIRIAYTRGVWNANHSSVVSSFSSLQNVVRFRLEIFQMLYISWTKVRQLTKFGSQHHHYNPFLTQKCLCHAQYYVAIWVKFGRNFPNVLILLKICTQHNWLMLVSNLEVIFWNLGKKRGLGGTFGENFPNILILLKICTKHNSGSADFKSWGHFS